MEGTRRILDLIPVALAQFTTLLRKERELAGAEISEKSRRAAMGLVLLVAGGILLIPGFFVLLLAAVAALMALGLASYWAALIIAALILIVSAALIMIGIGRLQPKNLMLHETAGQLREDLAMTKRQLRPDE